MTLRTLASIKERWGVAKRVLVMRYRTWELSGTSEIGGVWSG